MADEDTDLAQGAEAEGTEPASGPSPDEIQKKLDKVLKENAQYRQELRTTKITAEFGPEIAELIPGNLSLDEAKEYAAKLQAFRGGNQEQASQDDESVAAPKEEQSETERNLAAVAKPSTAGNPPKGLLTPQEIAAIAKEDPARATQILQTQGFQRVAR